MKYLITGFSGFVARHFLNHLESLSTPVEVLGIDIAPPSYDEIRPWVRFQKVNLLEKATLEKVIATFKPDYILHLASMSSVSKSWQEPEQSFTNNTNIFLNLVEAVRKHGISTRILSVGSSEEYGIVTDDALPLREDKHLEPISPYAVARVSQEMLSKVYVQGYGLQIILTRSFNHIGPWQNTRFVIPSFVKQLVTLKNHPEKERTIYTGDTSIVRDFVDVRDVVKAYDLLLKQGTEGEVYNICSGNGYSLKEIIDLLCELLAIEVTTEINPEFIRPADNPRIIGSFEKIQQAVQWQPSFSLKESLKDIIDYWQAQSD